MPNRRGTTVEPHDLEKARPWGRDRFDEPETQQARGGPGSRDRGAPVRSREQRSASEWCGVNPLRPIDPAIPDPKPGDQGG